MHPPTHKVLQCGAAHSPAQEPPLGSLALSGLKTLSKNQLLVTRQNIAGSWGERAWEPKTLEQAAGGERLC